MKNLLRLSLASLTVLFACQSEDPKPVKKSYFTLVIDPAYSTKEEDNWVVIHDTEGNLVDYKSFETGETIEFKAITTETPASINVSIFTFRSGTTFRNASVKSYLGISTGEAWTLRTESIVFPTNESLGSQFNIEVGDVGWGYSVGASNRNSVATTSSSTWNNETQVSSKTITRYKNCPDYLISANDELGNPRYKWLRDVQANDEYSFSFNDMQEFDHEVNISFPQTSTVYAIVKGLEPGQNSVQDGYFLNAYLGIGDYTPLKSLKLGYLSSLPKSVTWLSVDVGDQSLVYRKFGNHPEVIELPVNASFAITNGSISDFTFTANLPFQHRESIWSYTVDEAGIHDSVNWTIHGGEGVAQKVTALPTEFAAKYPFIHIGKLKHTYSSFDLDGHWYGTTYEQYVGYVFKEPSESREYSYYSVDIITR